MDIDAFVQKVLCGTFSQSEAEEYNTSDIFYGLAQEIRTYSRITKKSTFLCHQDNYDISEEDYYKVVNALNFVFLTYSQNDQLNFVRIVGKDIWMQSAPHLLRMMHTPETPLAEIFHYMREINYPPSAYKPDVEARKTHVVAKIKTKLRFKSILYAS